MFTLDFLQLMQIKRSLHKLQLYAYLDEINKIKSWLQFIIIKFGGLTTFFHSNKPQPQKIYLITPLVNHVEYKIGKLGGTFCHFISARIPEQKEFDILKLFSTKHSYFLRIKMYLCWIFMYTTMVGFLKRYHLM